MRCYLTDAAGRAWFPEHSIKYDKQFLGFSEQDFITDGQFEIALPESQYVLTVEHGPEYLPASQKIEVHSGMTQEVKIELKRWINMNDRGWYSGDLHTHRDWHEMSEILLAEDLNIGPTITQWAAAWAPDDPMGIMASSPGRMTLLTRSPEVATAGAAIRNVDSAHAYSIYDTEIERPGGAGTVVFVGLTATIVAQGTLLSPLDSDFAARVHNLSGYVDAEKLIYREVPVLVADGLIDFAGVVNNAFNRHGAITGRIKDSKVVADKSSPETPEEAALVSMDIYYKYLNCGSGFQFQPALPLV